MSDGNVQSAEEALFKPYDQFILFGDSITQMSADQDTGFGLQPALQNAYSRQLDVINRGFGGYSTAHATEVFPKFFPKPETAAVRFMTIFFGANDAAVPEHAQHIPVDTYKKNLKWIIQHPATVAQNPRILILTPPPVNEYQLEDFDVAKGTHHPSRTVRQTKLYSEAAREVAASLNIVAVDLWTAFMTAAGWKEGEPLIGSRDVPSNEKLQALFTDGLHLTGDGYRIIYEEVMKAIRANWPDQDPEVLPMVFPPWTEAPK